MITHTYATLEISQEAYDEIRKKIENLGQDYKEWLDNDGIILPNIKLIKENFLEKLVTSNIRSKNSKY